MLIRFLLIAWLGLLLATGARAQAPIVVHHIGPMTGVLASSNQEALLGARLYLDSLNARGGVGGRPVKLETLDDAQDAKKSAALLQQLVDQKKLLALLMPRTTPSTEAMLPIVAKAGVPMIGPHSGASFVNDPPKREVFPLRASYQKEAERAIRQQHSIGVRSFGLLLADDAFGRDTVAGIDRVMKELKLAPAGVAMMDNRKSDVSEAVQSLAEKRPEVVLLIASSKAAAEFVKSYRALGINPTFISLSNTSNNDYIQALGAQAAGAIVMQIMPYPFSGNTVLAREYGTAAAAAQAPLSYAGFYGFAAAKLLGTGLARAGKDVTPASLVTALEGLGEFDLGGFRLRYGPGDRTGSTYVDSTIITQDGRYRR